MRCLVILLALFAAAGPASAQSGFSLGRPELGQRLSPDQAREGARNGAQLPLDDLLPRIRAQVGDGQVLNTELEVRGERRIYVLRWKSAQRLMDLEVDAANGRVLRVE